MRQSDSMRYLGTIESAHVHPLDRISAANSYFKAYYKSMGISSTIDDDDSRPKISRYIILVTSVGKESLACQVRFNKKQVVEIRLVEPSLLFIKIYFYYQLAKLTFLFSSRFFKILHD